MGKGYSEGYDENGQHWKMYPSPRHWPDCYFDSSMSRQEKGYATAADLREAAAIIDEESNPKLKRLLARELLDPRCRHMTWATN